MKKDDKVKQRIKELEAENKKLNRFIQKLEMDKAMADSFNDRVKKLVDTFSLKQQIAFYDVLGFLKEVKR